MEVDGKVQEVIPICRGKPAKRGSSRVRARSGSTFPRATSVSQQIHKARIATQRVELRIYPQHGEGAGFSDFLLPGEGLLIVVQPGVDGGDVVDRGQVSFVQRDRCVHRLFPEVILSRSSNWLRMLAQNRRLTKLFKLNPGRISVRHDFDSQTFIRR